MTAYRQQALACAALLVGGPRRTREIRSVVPNATSILLRNVYGWFSRIGHVGAASTEPSVGEGSSIWPGSWTEAKAQDGSPGNLGDPAHVHVRANRQSGRRLNIDPGPEGPPTFQERKRKLRDTNRGD